MNDCKHLRASGIRKPGGFEKTCLACGFTWFEEDKPLTEDQATDKTRFEHSQQIDGSYKS